MSICRADWERMRWSEKKLDGENPLARTFDCLGMQTAENSPWSWYKKAGPITNSEIIFNFMRI
jgi:hypothetical protein